MPQRNGDGSGGPSATDRLKKELGAYLEARANSLADTAVARISGSGDGPGVGGLLGGAAKGAAQKAGDKVVGAVPGMGGDDDQDGDGEGGGGKGGGGGGKFTTVVEHADIGLPVRLVYDHWTQFEEFHVFAKGVQGVTQKDDVTTDWKLKIGPSSRSWEATTQEQVPDERIVWTSSGAKGSTRGAITFHELTPDLTRVVAVIEYYPAGFFEKTANLWRAQGRRLRLDLKLFQRYVTLSADEDVEGWRGEVRDGEVVRTHEEGLQDDEGDEGDEDSGPEDSGEPEGDEEPEEELEEDAGEPEESRAA